MKVNPKEITEIKKKFSKIKNKQDLLDLLNFSNQILYGEKARKISLKALTYYTNPQFSKKRYQTFSIKKKSGGNRTINAPVKALKIILRALNLVLQTIAEPHSSATGFVPGKSIVDNAKPHVGAFYVYNIDLKDFFHSFDLNRVKLGLMNAPFNLKGDRQKLAFLLASLTTHPFEVDGTVKKVLPQGSPTSPTLTNILCQKLDRRLNGLARRFNLVYTRYADDITFSGNHSFLEKEGFKEELERLITEDNLLKFKTETKTIGPQLNINPKKTHLQKSGYRQEVTGLLVNKKVNVHKRYIKQIRMYLYYWEKYGYKKANNLFRKDYIADKGNVKNPSAELSNVLFGKLEYLKMVKGWEDESYIKLKQRCDKLTNNSKSKDIDAKLSAFIELGFDFNQL